MLRYGYLRSRTDLDGGRVGRVWSRQSWGWLGLCVALLLLATTTAEARNVPGSASAVQSRIDQAVATSLIDTTAMTARDAALFDLCQNYLGHANADAKALRDPCEWGISLGGGVRYVEGSPNGFGFDFTSVFGSLAIAHKISPNLTVVASLIAEHGNGDLDYNKGTLDNHGVGGLAGVIVKLNDTLDFSVLGGAEWLNYRTTRSGGTYRGEYDAMRYIVDAQLRGTLNSANYFIEYGTGLRYIRQDNDAYQEDSGGIPFASVPGSGFTVLTGLADLKLGTKLPGITPYVQATGYVNFLENTDFAASFGTVAPEDQTLSGRLGIGADIDFLAGRLSVVAGVFADEDGFQGADGGLKFSKAF